MEYPIFFSHHLALRRKCGRLPYNLGRNRELVTSTCRSPLALNLQRKNMSADPHQKGKRQPITTTSDVSQHNGCNRSMKNTQASVVRFPRQYDQWTKDRMNQQPGRVKSAIETPTTPDGAGTKKEEKLSSSKGWVNHQGESDWRVTGEQLESNNIVCKAAWWLRAEGREYQR